MCHRRTGNSLEKLRMLDGLKDRLTIIQSLSGVGFRGDHTKGFGTLSLHDSEKVAVAPSLIVYSANIFRLDPIRCTGWP